MQPQGTMSMLDSAIGTGVAVSSRIGIAVAAAMLLALTSGRCQDTERGSAQPEPDAVTPKPAAEAAGGGSRAAAEAESARPAPGTDRPLFEKLGKPEPGDWLDVYQEKLQTFDAYKRSNPVRPTRKRRTILFQPLGEIGEAEAELTRKLAEWTGIFFDLPVRELEPRKLEHVPQRINGHTQRRQYHSPSILDRLLKPRVPDDALCVVGVTFEDLYPDPTWNFVFGQASLRDRVGVYSLIRYFPGFYNEQATADTDRRVLHRGIKVVTHETGHIFGITHCVEYNCLMNGSNSLDESDRRPLFVCPSCLRKLRWNIGFNPAARYRRMLAFLEREGLKQDAAWLRRRLAQWTEARQAD